jgi:pyruvate kinase
MAVVWGVEAICTTLSTITEESVDNSIKAFVSARRLKAKDRIIITAGVPVGVPGNTNLIQILDVE